MESSLIEHINLTLKDDPTGQRRKLCIAELTGARNAYVASLSRLSAQVKSHEASARELDVFLKILEREEPK